MKRATIVLGCILALTAFSGCDAIDDENDIWVTNGSGDDVERLTLDEMEKGEIDNGETRKFDNVRDGVHTLNAYRHANDETPCDSYVTDFLGGDDDAYWVIDEDCD